MKVQLQLRTTQQLTLTPQLQQSIRLLQLSTQELDEEVEEFLRLNPLLEREEGQIEDSNPSGAARDESTGSDDRDSTTSNAESSGTEEWSLEEGGRSGSAEDDRDGPSLAELEMTVVTLRDHLMGQVRLLPLAARDQELISLLVDHLDDDGYLRTPLEELLDAIPQGLSPVELDELQVARRVLQSLEPTGVGARDLAECIDLQWQSSDDGIADKQLGHCLLQHLDLLASHDYSRLQRVLGITEERLRQLQQRLVQFDPRPGSQYQSVETRFVVPDVVVRRTASGWKAALNQEVMPRLRISALYSHIYRDSAGHTVLAQQLQEARWLIKNIHQRFDTILRVSQAIVQHQRGFFEHGEVGMKPLVLREIADSLGLHESTVSRVTTQKFMLTPRGLFELKYFFSSQVGTESGDGVSSTAIRALIRQLIAQEDVRNPLSDQRISDLLGEQGFRVARRTVAKYREAMHLQVASFRKSL
ncbi:MAG: RNA polymerase factor sigma-54 [Ferrovum sp.]|nr:RNA polymerase factor sigma-54 [Ferrovum sp.]NDU87535.1 RNA polymerase factor sigma-54 [Ferrovum sp.]